MRKQWTALFVTIAVFAVTTGLLNLLFQWNDKSEPRAIGGKLDLSNWSFSEDGIVPLSGEWEFYPNQLLEHIGPNEENTRIWIDVPGSWSNKMDIIGMATYRLQLIVNGEDRVYGLKTGSIQMSNRIYVNGLLVGESGIPAGKFSSEAKNKPYVAYFTLKPGLNEILVHVANFDYEAGSGINHHIYFGDASDIALLRDKAIAHDWIVFASFLIMGLYFIGLYTQRRKDHFLLAFAFLCLFVMVFSSTRGERVLLSFFDVPYWLFIRIQFLSAIGSGMSLLFYLYSAVRKYCYEWLIRTGLVVGIILSLIVLFVLDFVLNPYTLPVLTIYSTFPFLYATYVFVLAALHKEEGSLYLIVAAVSLNIFALIQNLNVYTGVVVYSVAPFEPFLFLLMLALLMSHRFSNAFKQIERLSLQLVKADKLKDDFLAKTSHEFKTPLHGVMNIAQSMINDDGEELTPEQKEKLKLMTAITGRLSKLVYDILDLSKLKQGQLTIEPVAIDVRSHVEVNLKIYSYLLKDKNILLVNRVPAHLPFVLADERRFSQIIGNLLDNAVKHTEQGTIQVSAYPDGNMISITVEDTGEGIDETNLSGIFEPFMTTDQTESQSVGLGLTIVKQIVELHQGDISISSKRGLGTSVAFRLPIAYARTNLNPGIADNVDIRMPEEPVYSFKTPYFSDHSGYYTVLVVDDHFPNLLILIDTLKTLKCNVIAVKNGSEALEQINKQKTIDLVVLDIMMPGMSGIKVCQEIRKKFSLLELPVLMVTAAIQANDKLAAFDAGANDFLPKPFDMAELKARIKSLLDMKKSLEKAIEMEMAFLQSQIKPHFLYNALNSIVALSYTDIEQSRRLTTYLTDYLRGSFRFSNTQKRVTFAQELELIRSYSEIEKARFKDRLHVEYEISESALELEIPPLLIQPLVENAIRHGVSRRIEGGTVKIRANEDQGYFLFVIEDDGVGIEGSRLRQILNMEQNEQKGVGFLNINKRLKYEYGTEVQVESEPGKGTKVTVRIPSVPA